MHMSLSDKHDAAIACAHAKAEHCSLVYAPDVPDGIMELLNSNAELLAIIDELATRLDRISEYVKLKGGDED